MKKLLIAISLILMLMACGEKEPEQAEETISGDVDVVEITEPESVEPEVITASHILLAYDGAERSTATRTKEEAEEIITQLAADINEGIVTFEDAALEYSDCPSGARGGSLGEFGKGAMVGEFEDTAFALSVGGVSGVVETQFGFHLIKRTD